MWAGAMGRRPTMGDIANRVGVSRVAVSYALNGRPGVSEELRERILAVAAEIGFSASGPARALRGAATRAIGLAMSRPNAAFNVEVFRREFVSGVQDELSSRGFGLALQFVRDLDDEIAIYRRWNAEQRVAGVLVVDLLVEDPRVAELERLELPTVIVGGPLPHAGLACLWSGDAAAATELVEYLAALGHRRLARVSGPARLRHTATRDEAFESACARLGVQVRVVRADYTGEAGAAATRRILGSRKRVSAIVYDNEVMAVAGLGVTIQMGVRVPQEVSLVAWEDSPLCQVVRPALTVLKRDIPAYAAHAVQLLFDVIGGQRPGCVHDQTASLLVRASTSAAMGDSGQRGGAAVLPRGVR